jgi:glucose/mannose-6-phosphate isomerase
MLAVTARVPAVRGTLPDDAGDVVALFDGAFRPAADDVFADPFVDGPARPTLRLLLLADEAGEHRAPADRAGPVLQVAAHAGVRVSELAAEPGRPVEKLAQLIARTDLAATYLALGSGLDPSRSPHLADLREVWAERG